MSKETYTRIIDKYFSTQMNKNVISEDLTDSNIEDLSVIYGFQVKRGDEIFRFFTKKDDVYTMNYFSSSHRSIALRTILLDNKKVGDRGGIPVFG